jgi:hypothetical protein
VEMAKQIDAEMDESVYVPPDSMPIGARPASAGIPL